MILHRLVISSATAFALLLAAGPVHADADRCARALIASSAQLAQGSAHAL